MASAHHKNFIKHGKTGWRYCLGPKCLGLKKFRSTSEFNRICKSCRELTNADQNTVLYNTSNNGRTSRST